MVLIVGMARSGVAAARLLQSRGQSVFVTDSGNAPLRSELDSLGIPYETGGHTAARFLEAEEIVMSPGVPLDIPPLGAARRKGIPIVSEIEVAFRYLQGDIVAITGSNGKTTTTTLDWRSIEYDRKTRSGWRKYWNGHEFPGRFIAPHDHQCGRSQQLSAGWHSEIPPQGRRVDSTSLPITWIVTRISKPIARRNSGFSRTSSLRMSRF